MGYYDKYAIGDPNLRLGITCAAGDLVWIVAKTWPADMPPENLIVKNVTDGLAQRVVVVRKVPFVAYFCANWSLGVKELQFIQPMSGDLVSCSLTIVDIDLKKISVDNTSTLITGDGEVFNIASETNSILMIPSHGTTDTLFAVPVNKTSESLSYMTNMPTLDSDIFVQNFGASEVLRIRMLDGIREYKIRLINSINGTITLLCSSELPSDVQYSYTGDLFKDWTQATFSATTITDQPSGWYAYKFTGMPVKDGTYDVQFKLRIGDHVSNNIGVSFEQLVVHELFVNGDSTYTSLDGSALITISNIKIDDVVEIRYESPYYSKTYFNIIPDQYSPFMATLTFGDMSTQDITYSVTARVNGVETNAVSVTIPRSTQVLRLTANNMTIPCVALGEKVLFRIMGHSLGDTIILNTGFCTRKIVATSSITTYEITYPNEVKTYIASFECNGHKSNDVTVAVGC